MSQQPMSLLINRATIGSANGERTVSEPRKMPKSWLVSDSKFMDYIQFMYNYINYIKYMYIYIYTEW